MDVEPHCQVGFSATLARHNGQVCSLRNQVVTQDSQKICEHSKMTGSLKAS